MTRKICRFALTACLLLCCLMHGYAISAEGKADPQAPKITPAPKNAAVKTIPRQADAMDQFSYAMTKHYFPAARAKGEKRKEMCRTAITALAAVCVYFPKSEDTLSLMEARFYQGMCHKELGQPKEAAAAFLAAFRYPVPGAAINRSHATMITYHEAAKQQLLQLRDVLTPAEREEVGHEL